MKTKQRYWINSDSYVCYLYILRADGKLIVATKDEALEYIMFPYKGYRHISSSWTIEELLRRTDLKELTRKEAFAQIKHDKINTTDQESLDIPILS